LKNFFVPRRKRRKLSPIKKTGEKRRKRKRKRGKRYLGRGGKDAKEAKIKDSTEGEKTTELPQCRGQLTSPQKDKSERASKAAPGKESGVTQAQEKHLIFYEKKKKSQWLARGGRPI